MCCQVLKELKAIRVTYKMCRVGGRRSGIENHCASPLDKHGGGGIIKNNPVVNILSKRE